MNKGYLRQLVTGGSAVPQLRYPLSFTQEVVLGRDPHCQVVLERQRYASVSRRHALISPRSHPNGRTIWEICDLNSSNGTFVNGQRLATCQELQAGDRIMLGLRGPEFLFELEIAPRPPVEISENLEETEAHTDDRVTLTQLFPILSTEQSWHEQGSLTPAIATAIFVMLMFATVGAPQPTAFYIILATYLGGAAYYFVYKLCDKHKPWWLLAATAGLTVLLLSSPLVLVFKLVFREILPGRLPPESSLNFFALFVGHFFGAGLMEEFLKAIPVLLAYYIGRLLPKRYKHLGVWEPLDGILLGTASALGFTLLETLGQYVPQTVETLSREAGEAFGHRVGLELLIPRILGAVVGHMAYSGYLGYFIGLSAIKPQHRWRILGIGYLTASVLHALWNVSGRFSVFLLALVGVVSYAFLAAAILKARSISPYR